MVLPQSLPLLLLLHATGALSGSTPAVSEYRYFHGADEINRANRSLPIRFNGLAIGTNELDSSEAANGTIHALADGHHFGQRGWYHPGTDGANWEYLPDLRSSSSSLEERYGGDGERGSCGDLGHGFLRVCTI
jgi:hypothetical protein